MSKLLKFNNVSIDELHCLYETIVNSKDMQTTELKEDNIKIIEDIDIEVSHNIIRNAQNQASRIRENALYNAKKELEKAHEEGFKDGYTKGKKQAEKENDAVLIELLKLLKSLDEQKTAIVDKNNSEAKNLALTVARKVIDEKMASDDCMFLNLYNKAVQEFSGQKSAKLKISNHELQFVSSNLDYLLTLSKGLEHIDIVVLDDALRGTCIVETNNEVINASVATQFQIIEQSYSVEDEL